MMGYLYVRVNEYFLLNKCCKIGITQNIHTRESTYVTSEIRRGYFSHIFRILSHDIHIVEHSVKTQFKHLHVYYDGGTEIFSLEIIDHIENHLDNLSIKYCKVNKEDIDRVRYIERKEKIEDDVQCASDHANMIVAKSYQRDIINRICVYYEENDCGKLLWCCGLGKTLTSLFIAEKMKCKSIAIGVPNIYLQKQMKEEVLKVFPMAKILLIGGEYNQKDMCHTRINRFLSNPQQHGTFVITTYKSSHLLVHNSIKFDFKIGDEAHHLVSIKDIEYLHELSHHKYVMFHKITSTKSLFMTATERSVLHGSISMDNESLFGKTIDKKSIHWAIENKHIADYNLLVIKNKKNSLCDMMYRCNVDMKHIELFSSALMVLKSIERLPNLSHIVVYNNNIAHAELVQSFIDMILDTGIIKIDREALYNKALHSETSNLHNEIEKFRTARCGIITSVYIFGEGFDMPSLNGVCFAENMESEVRIVQCALRPCRLDKQMPDKIGYIIIPYIDSDNWEEENMSFEKVRKIISKIRSEDETIDQKLKAISFVEVEKEDDACSKNSHSCNIYIDNPDDLNNLRIRLRYGKTLRSNFSEEEDEYNYVKMLNKQLGLHSISSYEKSRNVHKNYIPDAAEYFIRKGVWCGWYDFIGVDTNKFIPTIDGWRTACKKHNIRSLQDYAALCKQHPEFPDDPHHFYRDFTNLMNELGIMRRR
jgi:predicted helicase